MTRLRQASSRGFTLLEVLVAVAILGLGLTMILSSQVGLFSGASRGQHFTVASNLARCKMSEIELELLKKGYQLTDQTDEGGCCGEDGEPGYSCIWKVERVELPPPSEMGADGGTDDDDNGGGPMAALGKLSSLGNPALAGSAGPPSLESLTSTAGEAMAGGGLATLAMGMVYPTLKPMLEASIRKISLKVKWKEGIKERELALTQYVTSPQQGLPPEMLAGGSGVPGMPGMPGMPGATGMPGAIGGGLAPQGTSPLGGR